MFSSPLSVITADNAALEEANKIAKVVMPKGFPVVMPNSFYEECEDNALRLFCHQAGIYQLINEELVDFLKLFIGQRSAIEVACGYGTLGRTLGIPFSDLRMQEDHRIRSYYEAAGQPTIKYPDDVKKMDANHAVKKLKPKVALACWITEKVSAFGKPKNMFGPDEHNIVNRVENYVVMGNLMTHGDKAIRKLPHYVIRAKWLNSRSAHKDENIMMIWGELPKEVVEAKKKMGFSIEYHGGITS